MRDCGKVPFEIFVNTIFFDGIINFRQNALLKSLGKKKRVLSFSSPFAQY